MHSEKSPAAGFAATAPALLLLAGAVAAGRVSSEVFAVVQEAAKAELRLSDLELSLVQGVAAAIPLAAMSLPIGLMIDRLNRLRLLLCLGLAWTAGLFLAGLANDVTMLFIAKMLSSLGANCSIAVVISMAADLCAPSKRGAAMLVLTLGKWAGTAAAFALGGWLLGALAGSAVPFRLGGLSPWRGVHLVLAMMSTFVVMLLLLFLREPARQETVRAGRTSAKDVFRELWARRSFLLPLFVGQVSVAMVDTAAGIWAAPILSRSYGLQPHQFAGPMGLVIFGAGVLGAVIGGVAADAGHKSARRGGILIGAVVAAIVSVPAALFPLAGSSGLFFLLLFLFLLCGTIAGLVVSAALATLLPNELRGFSLGLFIAIAGVIGFGIAPLFITIVSGWLGGESQLGLALAAVGTGVSLFAALVFPFALRNAPLNALDKPIR
ncbi:MFS transporter [Rhizorhabdus sp.]|jgi:MFS family permease|uniref:MFS transporter n=1 Tax=Rhizorhabdus sp. TaxID=1968843 RepID=UPI0035B4E6FA